MPPKTRERVKKNTPPEYNEQIRRRTERRIRRYAKLSDEDIRERLEELDREWDVERLLEANASALSLLGLVLARRNRGWLVLPGVVASFLLQHAVQGWCPPIPLFRRLGIRTESEIEKERYALKALRGDFSKTGGRNGRERSSRVLDAVGE